MKLLICVLFLFVIMHSAYNVHGECCYASQLIFMRNSLLDSCKDFGSVRMKFFDPCIVKVCGDGKAIEGTYCGFGKCNAFGCNCDGGCILGDARDNFKKIYGDRVNLI